MRRFVSGSFAVLSIFLSFVLLDGCSSGNPTSTAPLPTPATITLAVASTSVDIGQTINFVPTLRPSVAVPIVYTSSNPAVLSFVPASGGLACAGQWDTASHICTPRGAGVTQVTATANGVTSPPVTIYVHQHVDAITLSLINPPTPQPDCITLAAAPGIQNYLDFQAHAFSNNVDITNTVGSFTFSLDNSTVAKVNTSDPALNNNNGNQITQARVSANTPGRTQLFAALANVSSLPAEIPDKGGTLHPYFETCLVQSINLQVGNDPTNTTFAVANNTGGIFLTPTVIDRLGNNLTNPVPALKWISLSPATASVGKGATAGTENVGTVAPGGAGIVATCAPPDCNVGVLPVQSVYSTTTPSSQTYVGNPIFGLITGPPVTSKNVYVTTTQCGTIIGCQPLLFAIPIKTNTPGASTTLPSSPNSLVFAPPTSANSRAFMGSANGLMIFTAGGASTAATVAQLNNVPGKVLAVSLDGTQVIVSDTLSSPNQVYIVNQPSTGNAIATPLLIPGATAAAFSPDGLKAFIVGKSSPSDLNPDTLYVYSTVHALQTIPLGTAVNSVSFYANGSLAYLAGPNSVTMRNACDTTYGLATSFPGRSPSLFQASQDGVHAFGVESPGIDIFNVTVGAPPVATPSTPTDVTCPFPVSNPISSFVNLGQGNFTPLKLIVSSDNSRAYILASNLGSVFVFDVGVNTVSAIPLTGNPIPLDASLTPDGSTLYVGANDGAVHVVSTLSGGDLQQITFTSNNNSNRSSLCSNVPQTCNADLIAVEP
jgi:hypothetical protein